MLQLMNEVFGADVWSADPDMGTVFLMDGDITITVIRLLSFFIALAMGITLDFVLKRSRLGQADYGGEVVCP